MANWLWMKTLKSGWWLHIPLTHRWNSSTLTLPWQRATKVQFTFGFSKTASHFQHDESAVIHAGNGLSSHCLINKQRDPGEHLWILITLWSWQTSVHTLQNSTQLTSIQCFPCFPTNNCQKKQNTCQARFLSQSLLVPHFLKMLSFSGGSLVVTGIVVTQLRTMLRLEVEAKTAVVVLLSG